MQARVIQEVPAYTTKTSSDGTIKLSFPQGYIAVIIPVKEKYTVCVSSQVGCHIGCTFCYTGAFEKDLTAQEIVEQVDIAVKITQKQPQSVVFMGMGEPMSNFTQVKEAIDTIHEKYALTYKRITVSTSGVAINKLLGQKFNAALSLHSLRQDVRKKIMPLSMPLSKLYPFVDAYCAEKKYGLMIEYALMKGVNDTDEDMQLLCDHVWPKNINFNLIEYNDKGEFVRSPRLHEFKQALREKGYKCFIRHSRGADIEAACGMLDHE